MKVCIPVFRLVSWGRLLVECKGGVFTLRSRRKGVYQVSLTVSQDLLSRAQRGPVSDAEFIDCIRTSLPYAWAVVTEVAEKLSASETRFADNQTLPPDDDAQGQLLRLVASDAMRAAIERHFGVRIAFQNCCRLAMFDPAARDIYDDFVTPRAQLLNQRPEYVNC